LELEGAQIRDLRRVRRTEENATFNVAKKIARQREHGPETSGVGVEQKSTVCEGLCWSRFLSGRHDRGSAGQISSGVCVPQKRTQYFNGV